MAVCSQIDWQKAAMLDIVTDCSLALVSIFSKPSYPYTMWPRPAAFSIISPLGATLLF